MKFYGYEKDNERLMKLSEVTFDGTLEELEDLINFLKNVQEEHTKVVKKKRIYVIRIFVIGVINGIRRIQILLW